MNFITKQVIHLIKNEIKSKDLKKQTNFYYFDDPIKDGYKTINRINISGAFEKERILPTNWSNIYGKALIAIYDNLTNNNFFFYKMIDGKSYKAKLKKCQKY